MNSTYKKLLHAVVAFLLSVVWSGAFAALMKQGDYVEGEVLVKFKPGISQQTGIAKIAAFGDTFNANIAKGLAHVKLNAGKSVEQTIADYANDPTVEYAQPNYIYHITLAPNDANYAQQWAFKNSGQTISNGNTQPAGSALNYTSANPGTSGKDMNLETAWNQITDCSSVVVAVVDSGVNYNHQDLSANMWTSATYPNHGYNYTTEGNANDPMDLNGHGTHVAGIVGAAGNNSIGTTGVCWKASIMAVRVMDASGSGTTVNIVSGLNFAVSNGAKVVNMSLGNTTFDTAFNNAITNAQNNDVVVVVAAGNAANNNDGTTSTYPCNYTQSNLICVAALDQSYGLASFSNYGASSVDVGAPGTNILSTWAGSSATITDNLSSGWTTNAAGWIYSTVTLSSGTVLNVLKDLNYTASANHHIYRNYNLSGVSSASVSFYLAGVVNSGDSFGVGYSNAGGDPFTAGSTLLSGSLNSPGSFIGLGSSLPNCLSSTCTLGFSLTSASSSTGASGPIVAYFSINTLSVNNSSYNTIDGTSMASPAVAGVATMLRAYQPTFTYSDVVGAIKGSGKAASSLSGKTSTGKSVDAMAALAYINAPIGLTATVK